MDHNAVSDIEKIYKNETDKEECVNNEEYLSRSNNSLHIRRQAIISFGVCVMTLGAGATGGISAIIIPQMQNAGNDLSTDMISWIAAISCLALIFGNLISGYLMERFGRRLSILLLAVTFIAGWLMIGLSNELIYLILIGRFITGLCQGWLGPLGPVFVGEIATPTYRGLFLACLSLSIALGVFFSHLFGTLLHWSTASMLCGIFPLIAGIIIYYAPESPAWLASVNRIDDSITSFHWYRGRNVATQTELEKMLLNLKNKTVAPSKIQAFIVNIKKPEFYKPLLIMTVFFVISQLSGANVVSAYTTDMVTELMGSSSNDSYAYAAMLIIDVLRCVALGIACVLLKNIGRRPMALFSGVSTSLFLILLAVYLYLYQYSVIENISPIISLTLMALYIIVSNMGIFLLPWNMVGELFSVEMKGLGSGISVMMTSIAFFATVKSAPFLFTSIGHHGTYLFYGIATACGTLFLFICLPETKNKTLLEIEEYFKSGKKTRNSAASTSA